MITFDYSRDSTIIKPARINIKASSFVTLRQWLPKLEGGQGCWGGGVGELGEVDVGDWFTERLLCSFCSFMSLRCAEDFWAITIHPNGICSGVTFHEFYIGQCVTLKFYHCFIIKTPGTRTLVECRIEEIHLRILAGTFSIKFDQPEIADETYGTNLT